MSNLAPKYVEVIRIIETTPHNFTHHAAMAAKLILIRFLTRQLPLDYTSEEEWGVIKDSANCNVNYKDRGKNPSLQFLMDLSTLILYERGIDVYEIILESAQGECNV